MKKSFISISILILLLIAPLVYAEGTLSNQAAFCQHMGYKIDINTTENIPYCVFGNGTRCTLDDFYKQICSQDKIKDITPRKDGESVYLEFEKCEEGLQILEPKYLLDTYHCYKPFNIFNFFKNFFGIK